MADKHPWATMSEEEILRSSGLILTDMETYKEGITLAAILLFVLDCIQSVSARDMILREVISNILAHRDYSSGFPAKLIRDNNKVTKKEIEKAASVSEKTVERQMKKMSNVKYVGRGYSGHWEILNKK